MKFSSCTSDISVPGKKTHIIKERWYCNDLHSYGIGIIWILSSGTKFLTREQFEVWKQVHQKTHTKDDVQQRWLDAMKPYYKPKLYKCLCKCFVMHWDMQYYFLLNWIQFAIRHYNALLQNAFLFFVVFCNFVKKREDKSQSFYHAYYLLIGIDSASLSLTATSLEISWLSRLHWIEKRISAKQT